MRWRRLSWKACCGGGRFCLHLGNLFLTAILLLQIAIILSVHFVGTVPVPALISRLLHDQFARSGITVTWEQARYDLRGTLTFQGLQLNEAESEHLILTAANLRTDLYLVPGFFRDRFPVERVVASNVALHFPPELSSDGGETASIHIVRAQVAGDRGRRIWTDLHLRSGEAHFLLEGALPLPDEEPGAKAGNSAERWRELARTIRPVLTSVHRLPPLTANVTSAISDEGHWTIEGSLTLAEATVADTRIEEAILSFRGLDVRNRSFHRPSITRIRSIERPQGENRYRLHDLRVFSRGAPVESVLKWRLPEGLWIYGRPEIADLPFTSASGIFRIGPDGKSLPAAVRLSSDSATVHARPHLDFSDRSGTIDLTLRGNPTPLLKSNLLADGRVGAEADFSAQTRFDARIHLETGGQFASFEASLQALQVGVRDAHFDDLRLSANFQSGWLRVGPIRVHDPDEQWAEGYYLHDFTDHTYRIIAEGAVRARRLDSLLPSFYRNLWETIDPGKDLATADVDVRARWGENSAANAIVTARGTDLAYSGVPVERAHVQLWQASGFVDLMRLQASAPSGTLDGSIALTFPSSSTPDAPRLRRLDLESELPLDVLAEIFGDAISVVQEQVEFSTPPRLSYLGDLIVHEDGNTDRKLLVTARTDAPWTLRGVPFDRLSATLQFDRDEIWVNPLVANAGDGFWQASAQIVPGEDSVPQISFQTIARDLPYPHFLNILRAVGNLDRETESGTPPTGKVNLDLQLQYAGDPASTVTGGGNLEIDDADLGRLYLLGGLSRFFSGIGLNLAAFELNQVDSTIELNPGKIHLPDLAISGPSIRIESPGSLALPSTALDFRVKVFFLETEEQTLRSLLSPFLHPFGHVFELGVKGNLSEPEWNLVNSPFNFLRPRERKPPEGPEADDHPAR